MKFNSISDFSKTVFFGIFILALLSSCDTKKVYDLNVNLPVKGWSEKSGVEFKDIVISDTVSLHNFYINIRNSDDYRFSNFYLFFTTQLPNGKFSRDTIEIKLAELNGKWLGKGFGHYKDNQVLIRKAMRFPLSGKYQFNIEQGMREEVLTGINSVGIRIERLF